MRLSLILEGVREGVINNNNTPLAAVDSVQARTPFKLFIITERLLHV